MGGIGKGHEKPFKLVLCGRPIQEYIIGLGVCSLRTEWRASRYAVELHCRRTDHKQGKGSAMKGTREKTRIRIDGAEDTSERVLQQVHQRLVCSCHFSRHWREIRCDYCDGVLILRGRLPTFYLKQVLQSILNGLPEIERIENRVDVVSVEGLSSVRR